MGGVDGLVASAWERVAPARNATPGRAPSIHWSYQVTPPLPGDWPPGRQSALIYYAYAHGLDLAGGLADAVYVSNVWASVRVSLADLSALELEIVSGEISSSGVQGVWPIRAEEVVAYQAGERIEELLQKAREPAAGESSLMAGIARYYRQWTIANGVIAGLVKPHHVAFFAWLDRAAR